MMEGSPNSSQRVNIISLSWLKGHLTNSWPMRHGRVCWTLLGNFLGPKRHPGERGLQSPGHCFFSLGCLKWLWPSYDVRGALCGWSCHAEDDRAGGTRRIHAAGDDRHDVVREQIGDTWQRSEGTNSQQVSGEMPLCSQYLIYKS